MVDRDEPERGDLHTILLVFDLADCLLIPSRCQNNARLANKRAPCFPFPCLPLAFPPTG